MSEDAARELVQRMKDDEEFRARILAVEDGEERLVLIRTEGYDCTADEIFHHGRPLADREMDMAAAGHGFGFVDDPCTLNCT